MLRRTKIVATLGPATDEPEAMDRLLHAGVDVVRINLSHGSHEEHARRIQMVRERTEALKCTVGVLFDLQGPKIRIGRFTDGPVTLIEGKRFTLDAACPQDAGTQNRVGLTFPQLVENVSVGDTLLLDDGRIVLRIAAVSPPRVECTVVVGGHLSDSKGINRQGGGISAPALTSKDLEDIAFAAEMEADYLAVSFVRDDGDVEQARKLLQEAGGHGGIVAKIERAEALDSTAEIITAADAIMVARGDLGVEIGDAELPAVQKRLIQMAREMNRVVITATQMMESMIENAIPTRAEVFDVANAVLDGTDAVMLSAETAIGKNPAKVVATMGRICQEAEKHSLARKSHHRLDSVFGRRDEAIAMAAMYTANHLQVKAIAALTESGSTVKWMSRISSGIPIFALTRHLATRRKVTLFRGVYPLKFDVISTDAKQINEEIIKELLSRNAVQAHDAVIITKGDRSGVKGRTNTMKIMRVDKHAAPQTD